MTEKTKDEIKAFFQTGDRPTESQFIDMIDSWTDKSGPIGVLETALSAQPTGVSIAAAGTPSYASYAAVRNSMGITVYNSDTANAAVNVPVSAFATTAQAVAGLASGVAMDPVLTRNAISAQVSSNDSGWVPIKTVTAANVSTVDFVNGSGGVVLDGTYKTYAVVISDLIPATDNTTLYLRTSANSGSSYDAGVSNYDSGGALTTIDGSVSVEGFGVENTTFINLAPNISNSATGGADFVVLIFNPAGSTVTKAQWQFSYINNGSNTVTGVGGGIRDSAAAVNAIRFLMSAGNITSGYFTLYGLKSAS